MSESPPNSIDAADAERLSERFRASWEPPAGPPPPDERPTMKLDSLEDVEPQSSSQGAAAIAIGAKPIAPPKPEEMGADDAPSVMVEGGIAVSPPEATPTPRERPEVRRQRRAPTLRIDQIEALQADADALEAQALGVSAPMPESTPRQKRPPVVALAVAGGAILGLIIMLAMRSSGDEEKAPTGTAISNGNKPNAAKKQPKKEAEATPATKPAETAEPKKEEPAKTDESTKPEPEKPKKEKADAKKKATGSETKPKAKPAAKPKGDAGSRPVKRPPAAAPPKKKAGGKIEREVPFLAAILTLISLAPTHKSAHIVGGFCV